MGNPFSNSSGSPPSTPQQFADEYKAYTQFLPGISEATNNTTMPTAISNLNANLATTPINNALDLQQLQQYGLPTAQANQGITNSNALAGSQTNLNNITGPGGQAAMAAQGLNRATNPDYFKVADSSANQTSNLLNSFSLNGLSPGEYNATERSLNQSNNATGNLGLDNATNATNNAVNFGGAFNNKVGILNNALGTAQGTGNMLQNNGFNSTSTALGMPAPSAQSSFGAGSFGPSEQAGSSATSSANNIFSGLSSLTNTQLDAQAKSNYQNSPQGSFVANSSACCFIFMESYHGAMPSHVRRCRDSYYASKPQIATGYKRMAKWLVPLMRYSSLVRSFVWHCMVSPLSEYGKFVVRKDTAGRHYKSTTRFWFSIWNFLGRN